ncbi:hypothetical protein [Streptomyces sp. 1331.2]|uniref:hypothetical protein n=1 Tax=Streptomyces sp. 1331.2 TaxID=1938835 RepID=UPI000BD75F3A|nr:hypothetical protein [Streptomyces sp. 1331.2]SOB88511.1 hypothetical protein SAMN06272789_6796 [Streptomyces sp. 1331.2]
MSKQTTTGIPTLTADDKLTLQTAAHGVAVLMAASDPGAISSTKAGMAAGKALTAATGLVGRVLAEKPKGLKFNGKSTADIADQVFDAILRSLVLLAAEAPEETDNFRATLTTAVHAAQQARPGANPAQAAMADKITDLLDRP